MKGSCLCGAVRYELRGGLTGINYCHCAKCRKASGTAFATSAGVAREDFVLVAGADGLAAFESSPGKRRHFCAACGSPIYSERDGAAVVYVRLGTLDDDPPLRPQVHIHVAEKAAWFDIADELPQLAAEEGLWF